MNEAFCGKMWYNSTWKMNELQILLYDGKKWLYNGTAISFSMAYVIPTQIKGKQEKDFRYG
jgi:hypothetical protein